METLIQIEHMSFCYPGEKNALQDIRLRIGAGEFIVLCGSSGCGKTTLLRQMKSAIAPHGKLSGQILFHDVPLNTVEQEEQAGRIGFVSQNPEDAIVTDKVWHELAFGLESLGTDNQIIRKRVAEMSHFFGIQEWFHRDTASLSGGQKQLLNLAAVMVMQPEILLLDEPTSQLDPIAASDFLEILERIHRELGTTIFLTEHRLEEVLPYCSRLVVMEDGFIRFDGRPEEVAEELSSQRPELFRMMPAPMRIWNAVDAAGTSCPRNVQEGREWFCQYQTGHELHPLPEEAEVQTSESQKQNCTIELKDVWFRYEKKGQDVLCGLSLRAYSGQVLAVLGGNGSGKTTMLSMLYGVQRPQRGSIRTGEGKRLRLLPQNPQLLFVADTVQQELRDILKSESQFFSTMDEAEDCLEKMISLCQLEGLMERHPYDLSGGEQQRLGLAKVLLSQPDILLLDEPTKGLDVECKEAFADILKHLKTQGTTIIMVSHDVEFCAEWADRCVLLFDGQVAAEDTPERFFSGNYFYTTNANRMVRQTLPLAVTVKDVILACGGRVETGKSGDKGTYRGERETPEQRNSEQRNLEQRNSEQKNSEQKNPESGNSEEENLAEGNPEQENSEQKSQERKSLVQRKPMQIFSLLVPLLVIPFTIYAGIRFWGNEKYVFISLLILLECMLPFFLRFERKKPPARNIVMLSVLCALGVAGRAVFATLAQVKPVTAITILTGAVFGGETGFMVGAVTMLVSNMLFGQGPWTPWQMFAMGMIGLLAGVLFYNRPWHSSVLLLTVYGFLAAVLIYGGIMNPASAIMGGIPMTWQVAAAYWLSGLPMDLLHGAATVLFLLLGARPMLRKLERVIVKFGWANQD